MSGQHLRTVRTNGRTQMDYFWSSCDIEVQSPRHKISKCSFFTGKKVAMLKLLQMMTVGIIYIYISVIFIIIAYYLLFYEKKLPMLKLLQMMIVGIIYIYISVIFIIISYYLLFYEKKLPMLRNFCR